MSNTLAELRSAFEAAPQNLIMRMMLVRKLVEAEELSEALVLAMNIRPDAVTALGDRRVLADLFSAAGLTDQASQFTVDAEPLEKEITTFDPSERPRSVTQKPGSLRLVADANSDPSQPELTSGNTIRFVDIGGLAQVKKDIERRIVLPFAQPGLVARFRKASGGGVLLYGPPGCGKTLLARATAGECGARFLNAPLSEILHPHPGESERRLSALFAKARKSKPTVLFFDEIEALAAKRSSATHSHVGQLISHFLTEFDGVESDNTGVLILAATNTPWLIDPAFLRAGRFDRLFFIPPPDKAARKSIFDLEFAGRPCAGELDTEQFASVTAGLSGADIRSVVEAATDTAIDATLESGTEVAISTSMVVQALDGFSSSVGDWLATAKDYATYANESGRYDDVLEFLATYGRTK